MNRSHKTIMGLTVLFMILVCGLIFWKKNPAAESGNYLCGYPDHYTF